MAAEGAAGRRLPGGRELPPSDPRRRDFLVIPTEAEDIQQVLEDLRADHHVEALFDRYAVPRDFDLLSIDIDGNDYWVWKAIERYRPRAVIVEYNVFFQPTVAKTIAYDAARNLARSRARVSGDRTRRFANAVYSRGSLVTSSWSPAASRTMTRSRAGSTSRCKS